MAVSIDDSNAPKGIPSDGPIAVGISAGVDSSINLLKNIKKETAANEPNSKYRELSNWFYEFVGNTGNFTGSLSSTNAEVKSSQWKNSTIVGFTLKARNESASTYNNANNATLTVRTYFGFQNARFKYTMSRPSGGFFGGNRYITQQKTPASHASSITFTGMNGDLNGYNFSAQYSSGVTLGNTLTMVFNPARTGTPSMEGSTTVGTNSQVYNFSNTGPGTISSEQFFALGVEDSSSANRRYGTSFTYP
jgi:hypothetical protein